MSVIPETLTVPAEPVDFPQDAPPAFGKRLLGVDGLRGLAILMVMALHFFLPWRVSLLTTHFGKLLDRSITNGVYGVDLFFVISGFLITGILMKEKNSPRYFLNFYARRTLRIFPLYYGVLIVLFVVLPMTRWAAVIAPVAPHQGWLWLYATNIAICLHGWVYLDPTPLVTDHFWSLAVEEHFYLIWPAVVLICSRRMLGWTCVALTGIACLCRLYYLWHGRSDVAFVFTPCRADGLAIGALLAVLLRNGTGKVPRLLPVAIGAFVVWVVLPHNHSAFVRDVIGGTVLPTMLALTFAGLIYLVVNAASQSFLASVFARGPLIFVGRYSYGLYVYHQILSHVIFDHTQHMLQHLPTIVAWLCYSLIAGLISFAIAIASFHLFEAPLLRLKRHFSSH